MRLGRVRWTIYRDGSDRQWFCCREGKRIDGIERGMARARRAVAGCGSVRCSVRVPATVTHSPINFGSRSIDHNVLFCSLVFLSAAFDSIRGCGESIYLPRCHAPPVMDGCCTLTLTPKGEAVPRTYPHQARLRFRSWSFLCLSFPRSPLSSTPALPSRFIPYHRICLRPYANTRLSPRDNLTIRYMIA